MVTTIQLEEKIKQQIDELKNHPRETYNEVLKRLVKIATKESEEELSPQTIKNIQKSLEDIKVGRVSSHKEVKRRLGIK
ncbi:MAG: hypothetical protein FJ356_00255 [Thaumarchaeota archaeon]|nr:hypothetical protein [Nitrososphaerota archaeon]